MAVAQDESEDSEQSEVALTLFDVGPQVLAMLKSKSDADFGASWIPRCTKFFEHTF